MDKPKKAVVVFHYPKYDKDCTGDYASVEVLFDGKQVRRYGDYYHEKGDVRAEEFVDGVQHVLGQFPVTKKSVADFKG